MSVAVRTKISTHLRYEIWNHSGMRIINRYCGLGNLLLGPDIIKTLLVEQALSCSVPQEVPARLMASALTASKLWLCLSEIRHLVADLLALMKLISVSVFFSRQPDVQRRWLQTRAPLKHSCQICLAMWTILASALGTSDLNRRSAASMSTARILR